MRTKHYKLVGALAIAVCSTVGLAGCGGDDDTPDGGGGGAGDAVSEYCAKVDDVVAKLDGGDAAAMTEAAGLGVEAAKLDISDPDVAAKVAECSGKLSQAMMP